jgi:hypothetical protein
MRDVRTPAHHGPGSHVSASDRSGANLRGVATRAACSIVNVGLCYFGKSVARTQIRAVKSAGRVRRAWRVVFRVEARSSQGVNPVSPHTRLFTRYTSPLCITHPPSACPLPTYQSKQRLDGVAHGLGFLTQLPYPAFRSSAAVRRLPATSDDQPTVNSCLARGTGHSNDPRNFSNCTQT